MSSPLMAVLPLISPQVPDYPDFIAAPMDFSCMRSKMEAHTYRCLADLEADFNLMVSNCLLYNAKDTVFHRAALRLRDLGGAVLRHAQRQAANTGLDPETGLHLAESPQKQNFYSCTWEDGEFGSKGVYGPLTSLRTLLASTARARHVPPKNYNLASRRRSSKGCGWSAHQNPTQNQNRFTTAWPSCCVDVEP